MQFIDLKEQQKRIYSDIEEGIQKVLAHGQYIMGPEVAVLEEQLADFVGVNYCIAVSSGTDALLLALMALEIQPGDEVITSPFTFISVGEVIRLIGATPVFVDIESSTYNLDPDKLESAITSKTRAIIPVSLYGQCANFPLINEIAEKHALPVIEDGAQSFGASQNKQKSCGLSDIGCTSFFPSKPLGAYGDGGACFTNDEVLAKRLRELRIHGQDRRYNHPVIGINGRMDTMQAAILLAKFKIFPEEVELRSQLGLRFNELITRELPKTVNCPKIAENNKSVFAQYTIQVDRREYIQTYLKEQGVPTAVHYPIPLYRQPAFSDLNLNIENYLNSENASSRVLSLPMHPYLREEEQKKIVDVLKGALESS